MQKRTPFIILLLFTTWPLAAQAADLGVGRVSLVQGPVRIETAEAKEWTTLAVNTPLEAGDRFWCPASARLELQLADGTRLRLDQNSVLDVLQLQSDTQQFYLSMGRLYVSSSPAREGRTLQVDLPDTSVVVSSPSRFRLDLASNGAEEISIFRGALVVAGMGAKTTVRTGERLTLENGSAEVSPLNPPDEWEGWNEARDRKQAVAQAGTGYLPGELAAYAGDLNTYGEWLEEPEYGPVWHPRGLPAVWAPYRLGHWIWVGGDYVWISFEPWGWAPFHYGRWVFLSFGWCWVPPAPGAVYWGPGFVGWIYTPGFVGWVPLAPGEIYYGYGYYGPNCIDLRRTRVRREEIKHVYRYITIKDALTGVTPADFAAGKTVPVPPPATVAGTLTQPAHYSAGRPDIAPQPSARLVGRPVPSNQLPTPLLGAAPVRELKARHPLLRETVPEILAPGPRVSQPAPAGGKRVPQILAPAPEGRPPAPRREQRVPQILAPAPEGRPPAPRREQQVPQILAPAPEDQPSAPQRQEQAPQGQEPTPRDQKRIPEILAPRDSSSAPWPDATYGRGPEIGSVLGSASGRRGMRPIKKLWRTKPSPAAPAASPGRQEAR